MITIVIIQARMGSTRLPGKVLMNLGHKPVIQHVIERAGAIVGVSRVVLATSTSSADDALTKFCESLGVPVFRGSEDDVLDRYYQAARQWPADLLMRVTGDCPLLDPLESGKVLRRLIDAEADYASNCRPPTFPDGLDTEAMTFAALERTWREATLKSEREHVTLHIANHPERFHMEVVRNAEDLSDCRLTLDEEADYQLLSEVFRILERKGQFGHLGEVMAILRENPQLTEFNMLIERNEGLKESLAADQASCGGCCDNKSAESASEQESEN